MNSDDAIVILLVPYSICMFALLFRAGSSFKFRPDALVKTENFNLYRVPIENEALGDIASNELPMSLLK